MPSKPRQSLITVRRLERARALEALNQRLKEYDDLVFAVEQTNLRVAELDVQLERSTVNDEISAGRLAAGLNHRARLKQRLEQIKTRRDALEKTRQQMEDALAEARDRAAKAQRALKIAEETDAH